MCYEEQVNQSRPRQVPVVNSTKSASLINVCENAAASARQNSTIESATCGTAHSAESQQQVQ